MNKQIKTKERKSKKQRKKDKTIQRKKESKT